MIIITIPVEIDCSKLTMLYSMKIEINMIKMNVTTNITFKYDFNFDEIPEVTAN